ncbi:ATP-binding cassette domain-containing protein [Sulfitobacter sp. 1151]|uniref:ATP-binding cassette domain-containing protein n=2 Tax=Parasulfitobacter algicola TaxID=2614809 RepID=A0ABX2IRQ9_9RHOB|nr:ATP-binding cassette domain-containing protein [Sulfitobacter algicola]
MDPKAPTVLELCDIRLIRDEQHLVNIPNLTIRQGAPTLIMGPNGAGKSLLLRLMHGLISPTQGRVDFDTDVQQAMVFQRPVLLRRSVAGNIDFVLKAHRIPRAVRKDRVNALLRMADLIPKARQSARTLSGGEQQRLALVRALALKPKILFLDEPTASLDPSATHAIEALIRQANDAGTKIIMVTHDPGQASRLGGEIVFLHKGQVLEQTGVSDFLTEPKSTAAKHYLAGGLLF